MATQRESVFLTENGRVKIIKLKVKEGSNITIGQILFQFEPEEDPVAHGNGETNSCPINGPSKHSHVVRATSAGLVEKVYIKEGDVIEKGYLNFTNVILYQLLVIINCVLQVPHSRVQ